MIHRQRFAAAIRSNDAAEVRRLLAEYPELRATLDEPLDDAGFGETALLAAVHRDNREMAEVLLDAGASIDQRSHWWAGSFGVLDHDGPLRDFLIARGATVDAHAAARFGWVDSLRALLDADPTLVHARGGDGQTPLHFATTPEIADLLLARGADVDARDVDHESTPVMWMVKERPDMARYLVRRGCRTDILLAAALGDRALVERHLADDSSSVRMTVSDEHFPRQDPRAAGTIYNWTLGSGKGPHVIARERGHGDIFELLMERSPAELQLSVACEVEDEPRARAIVARDPSVVQRLTPADHRKLPDAAREQQANAVRVMLSLGWPVDARGQHAATALHWAAWNGMPDLVREILTYHPPLELLDNDFQGTPLDWTIYASKHGWPCSPGKYGEVAQLLLDAGANLRRPPADMPISDDVRAVIDPC
jgi:ankyrin repeat protein